jgi:asparagine synthase (glutamine-hydrolysing)
LTAASQAAGFRHHLALGHRRYSIIDLSPSGHQPYWSDDRNVCVAFNGEIYNYVELREELTRRGRRFRTSSDTEVLAQAYLEWGTEAFGRFVGFWALTLYDARIRKLLVSRDRLGKASLFVANVDGTFWWSSEIKGLVAGAGQKVLEPREQGVADFVVRDLRDVHEQTFFQRITTFPKASYAWIEADGSFEPKTYWSLPTQRMSESDISMTDAAQELRARMSDAVRIRLRADVPVGFELSGGLDSSSLFAVAANDGHRIRAFTIGFPGTSADEAPFARSVCGMYPEKSDLTVVNHETEDFFQAADSFVGSMDEPFHSPNVMSIQRIWRAMRSEGIRVTISGNAGDELFAGYPGVYHSKFLWEMFTRGQLARFHRECALYSEEPGGLLSSAYRKRVGSVAAAATRIYMGSLRARLANASKMREATSVGFRSAGPISELPAVHFETLLRNNMSEWQMNYWLRISNIAGMNVPIEIRSPLLDHRIVEFVFSLPVEYLIRDGWLKWILRFAMKDLLPEEVLWRTNKRGFPFPYKEWLGASKQRFFAVVRGSDNPYLDFEVLKLNYDRLAVANPLLLWRMMSLAMWWKKTVEGKSLAA